jgi:hypothetical protein
VPQARWDGEYPAGRIGNLTGPDCPEPDCGKPMHPDWSDPMPRRPGFGDEVGGSRLMRRLVGARCPQHGYRRNPT